MISLAVLKLLDKLKLIFSYLFCCIFIPSSTIYPIMHKKCFSVYVFIEYELSTIKNVI